MLMPIRASTLRRPASKARSRLTMAASGVTSSAPRVPASSAASSMASQGTTALAPDASVMAAVWTSRTSARVDHDVRLAAQARVGERGVHGARRQHGADGQPAVGRRTAGRSG